jgi:hypothetical protein
MIQPGSLVLGSKVHWYNDALPRSPIYRSCKSITANQDAKHVRLSTVYELCCPSTSIVTGKKQLFQTQCVIAIPTTCHLMLHPVRMLALQVNGYPLKWNTSDDPLVVSGWQICLMQRKSGKVFLGPLRNCPSRPAITLSPVMDNL